MKNSEAEEQEVESETSRRSHRDRTAQTDRIGLGDLIIGGLIGFATFFFQTLWAYPGLYPRVWNDAAVAFGTRTASNVIPGYWTAIVSCIHMFLGDRFTPHVLRLTGHVVLACVAVMTYLVLREMLVFIMRARPQRSRRRTLVMMVSAALGTASFIAMDPVWTAGQCFSEMEILLLITMMVFETFFIFLRRASIKWGYLMAIMLGFLAAETPFGLLMMLVFLGLNYFILKVMPAMDSPFFKPAVIATGKWHLTFLFAFSFAIGIAFDCKTFADHGGLIATGSSMGDLPLRYVKAYVAQARSAAGLSSILLWAGICLAPFLVSIFRFPPAADEEKFLSYSTGIVFCVCGLIGFSQCASLPVLWFWTHFPMKSQYLLVVGLLMCSMTFTLAMMILGVDALCRSHLRLTRVLLGYDDDDDNDDDLLKGRRMSNFMRRAGLVVIPMVLLAAMYPARVKEGTRAMLTLINDALALTAEDASGLKYLVTDGRLDIGVEAASVKRGESLKCLALIKGKDMTDATARHLNTRGMENDPEDMKTFGYDVGMGLRTWLHDRPQKMKDCGAQLGFDLWKRDGLPLPPMGGMLARPGGWRSEQARQESIAKAKALAERVLNLYGSGAVRKCGDLEVQGVFESVTWRLARMCTYRGDVADINGDVETAIAEADLAKKLNDRNGAYKTVMAGFRKVNENLLKRLTPREGLQLALVRADFAAGRYYAETILSVEPEDPDANWTMGMHYLNDRQYNRAAAHLRRVLVKRPNEPAVYNNLAMIDLTLGKLDSAEVNVGKALKLKPDAAAIIATKRSIEKARKEKAEAKR